MNKLISILTAIAIIFQIFTPIRLYIEGGRALMMLIPAILIVISDKLFVRRSFWPMFFYILVCLLIMLAGSEYFNFPFLISVFFAYTCFEHFVVRRDFVFAKITLIALYGTLMVLVFISLPLFIAMPNLSRLMIDAEESGVMEPIMFWTVDYPTLHALPVYSIPLFFLLRNGRAIVKLFMFVFIAAIFVLMFFADTTTALIINIVVYAILLIYNPRISIHNNIIRLFGLLVFGFLLLNKTVIIGFLSIIQPIFEGSSTYMKIDEIKLMLLGSGTSGDIEAREEKIEKSWNSFVANPLFPELDINNIGSHNVLFDQIVAMGLVPGITFFWFLIDRIRRPLRYLNSDAKPYYLLGVLTMLLMGLTKNFFLLFPACTMVPMLLIASSYVKQKTINS